MSRRAHARVLRRGWALAAVALLLLLPAVGGAAATAPAVAAGPADITVTVPERDGAPPAEGTQYTDAQLRWGLNAEAGSGAFAGGCNFVSAGVAGDNGGPTTWPRSLYRAQDGAVRIEKPTAGGGWTAATWESKCLDAQGVPVSSASTTSASGNQVVIDGGTGSVRDGTLELRWSGSFTVAFYGGMTYWSVTDPVLTLDRNGDGRLVATASGYGTSMNDMSRWEPIPAQSIVLADIHGADTGAASGFTVAPAYRGVPVDVRGGAAQTRTGDAWGAFPQSFVDFHRSTGQHAYWYSSGGVRDAAKPASELFVSYDAAAPIAVTAPAAAPSGAGGTPANPLRLAPPSAAALVPPAPLALAASTPLTSQPEREGLVPGAVARIPPLVPPLLGSAAALSVAIVAVLSMMQMLPWQRRLL